MKNMAETIGADIEIKSQPDIHDREETIRSMCYSKSDSEVFPSKETDLSSSVRRSHEKSTKTHVEVSPQGRYLRFDEKLGSGQYKNVFRAYDTVEGIEVAWNTVNVSILPKNEMNRIINEVRLLQNLEHKNLVQFRGSWVNREKEEVIFITEIVVNGSLKDFIQKISLIRWKVIKRWGRQILDGLEYMHTRDVPIIHRDLKCDNIFINGHTGDIRIGDLGLSTSCASTDKNMSVLGTPEFMAPELYDESYNEKVDIYAFGMCVLEMITKDRPYSECANAAQIYKKVLNRVLPADLNRIQRKSAVDFIKLCIDFDPNNRPTAAELLKHPFLAESQEEEDNEEVAILESFVANESYESNMKMEPTPIQIMKSSKHTDLPNLISFEDMQDEVEVKVSSNTPNSVSSVQISQNMNYSSIPVSPTEKAPFMVESIKQDRSFSFSSNYSADTPIFGHSLHFDSHGNDSGLPPQNVPLKNMLLPEVFLERLEVENATTPSHSYRGSFPVSQFNSNSSGYCIPKSIYTSKQILSPSNCSLAIEEKSKTSAGNTVPEEKLKISAGNTVSEEKLNTSAGIVKQDENVYIYPVQIKSAKINVLSPNTLHLAMLMPSKDCWIEIEFDFDIECDSVSNVVAEMVRELGLPHSEFKQTAELLNNLIRKMKVLGPNVHKSISPTKLTENRANGRGSNSDLKMLPQLYALPRDSECADRGDFLVSRNNSISSIPDERCSLDPCTLFESAVNSDSDSSDCCEELKQKMEMHYKRVRQARRAYESRQANLMKAIQDCKEENIRQQEKFRKTCEEFERKKLRMEAEFEDRMAEFENEWLQFEKLHRGARKSE